MSTWYDFVSGCPVEDCCNEERNVHWKHPNCDGSVEINEEVQVRCKRCGITYGILSFPFACGKHAGACKAEFDKLKYRLAVAIVPKRDNKVWALKFSKNLIKITRNSRS